MRTLLGLVLGAGLLFAGEGAVQASTAAKIGAVGKAVSKLPILPAFELIESLTTVEPPAKVRVLMRSTLGEEKLVVARSRLDVTVSRESSNWRGRLSVELSMPANVPYHLDLAKVQPSDLRFDAKRRVLRVTMPAVQVGDIAPVLNDMEVTPRYSGWRIRHLDGKKVYELQTTMLRDDFEHKALEQAREQLPAVRDQARAVLQRFLQRTFDAARAEVTVVVE